MDSLLPDTTTVKSVTHGMLALGTGRYFCKKCRWPPLSSLNTVRPGTMQGQTRRSVPASSTVRPVPSAQERFAGAPGRGPKARAGCGPRGSPPGVRNTRALGRLPWEVLSTGSVLPWTAAPDPGMVGPSASGPTVIYKSGHDFSPPRRVRHRQRVRHRGGSSPDCRWISPDSWASAGERGLVTDRGTGGTGVGVVGHVLCSHQGKRSVSDTMVTLRRIQVSHPDSGPTGYGPVVPVP
ncbi:MAG: hypothetical protein QG608_236 [Actinomycetota bacterium]|nr:hypothetical protein [Actinomycetota bacterium]